MNGRKNGKNSRGRTFRVALCGIFTALGVVVMYLGSLIEVLDLTAAVIASLFCVIAVIELKGSAPIMIFSATALLSLLLIPNKFAPTVYLLLAGYYPIVKEKLEMRFRRRIPCFAIKLLMFNVAFAAILAVSVYLLLLPIEGPLIAIGLILLGNLAFVLYDIALTRLISMYFYFLRPRFKFFK